METTVQEIIYQLLALIASGIVGYVGLEVKSYFRAKKDILGYEFDNDRFERIIDNSIDYAEGVSNEYFKIQAKKMAGNDKLDFARKYVNMIEPSKVAELGDRLDSMISRRVVQKYSK